MAEDHDQNKSGAAAARSQGVAIQLANALPGRNTAGDRVKWGEDTALTNKVQLSTYPDTIGGTICCLNKFVREHLEGVVHGVHILPFYPSSADRGFAPLTYREVDSQFGTWEEVEGLAKERDICADFMINHVSAQSMQFKDFEEKGDDSEYAKLFIKWKDFWGGEPSEEDVEKIYKRKEGAPTRSVKHADGTERDIWCTFSDEQIDINAFGDEGKKFVECELEELTKRGIDFIRVDAFGYTTKKKGTNCFFIEPEIWQLLDHVRDVLCHLDSPAELLCELHEHYIMQKSMSEHKLWVYDFALPMLCLQAMYDHNASNLKAWLYKCPRMQVTTLDTHDGLGIVDVADLMTDEEVKRTKSNIYEHGTRTEEKYSTSEYGNMDTYQLNSTYYSAVGSRDDWYLLARAIQFFTPGIPLVYYIGLLAGENDIDLVESTQNGRDLNRHKFEGISEAAKEIERPVVSMLFELCRFRNAHPAFNGLFELVDTKEDARAATELGEDAQPTDGAAGWLKAKAGIAHNSPCTRGKWGLAKLLAGEDLPDDCPECDDDAPRFSFDSPALACNDVIELMKSPDSRTAESDDTSRQNASCAKAIKRDMQHDLPNRVLVMKWTHNEHWALLDADIKDKVFRIIYSDPDDNGAAKVWNVTSSFEAFAGEGGSKGKAAA